MEYKVVTTTESITVEDTAKENSLEKLSPYIAQGYKILHFSATHERRPNTTTKDHNIKSTLLFVMTSYLLVKD